MTNIFNKKKYLIPKIFILILLVLVFWSCYLIFKPFLIEIFAAVILVTIFYSSYEKLVKFLWNKKGLASFVMCVLISLLIIIPVANLITYGAKKSVSTYEETINFIEDINFRNKIEDNVFEKINIGIDQEDFKRFLEDTVKKTSNLLVSGATNFIKETTNFLVSLVLIIFTMFFFFIDGVSMLDRLMYLTPLPNKYDRKIFEKFRDVSYSTMLSTFITSIAQGLLGAFGFIIVGLPAFFAGVFMAVFSLVPYIGATIIWLPVSIFLFLKGNVWEAIFLAIWGSLVVGSVDNLIRAYLIKDKAQVHPIFIIFSILGGISLFGFWGVIIGPLIISLAVTILHIYEIEYKEILEK